MLTDDEKRELIAEGREATACRCVDAPEQECGTHGDAYSRLLGAFADALEAATRVSVQGEHQHEWDPETSPPRMTCGCDAVKQGEPNDVPELVDVVLTTADIEQLAHLLVQLSPATQKNSGATVRRLMQEMNIKEVDR